MEMRFYIPGMPEKGDGDDEDNESKAGSEDEADDDGEGKKKKEARTAAEVFYDTLVTKADIGDVAGDSFAIFPSILFLTPRYDLTACLDTRTFANMLIVVVMMLTCTRLPSASVARPMTTKSPTKMSRNSSSSQSLAICITSSS